MHHGTMKTRCASASTKLVSVSDLTIVLIAVSASVTMAGTSSSLRWRIGQTGGTYVRNVSVSNTSFVENSFKGIYAEKLSDATFVDCTVRDNGHYDFWNGVWNAGFDINLKGNEV